MPLVLAVTSLTAVGTDGVESPCEGISDGLWADMRRIADEHFQDGSSKGKTFKYVRKWLASHQPPIVLTGRQKRCWTREFGKRFDERDRRQAKRDSELAELAARQAREAHEEERASLTTLEREWVAFQGTKRLAAIEQARAKLEGALRTVETARRHEQNPDARVGGSGPFRFARIYNGPRLAEASAIANSWSVHLRALKTNDPEFVFTIHPWDRGTEKAMGRFDTTDINYWVYQVSGPKSLVISHKRFEHPSFALQGMDTSGLRDGQTIGPTLAPLAVRGLGKQKIRVFGSQRSLPLWDVVDIDVKKLGRFYESVDP